MSDAGFDQIELWRQDVEACPGGAEALRRRLDDRCIRVTDYQVLHDFDGAPGDLRHAERREALSILDTAVRVGADTLLAPASTDPNCDAFRVVEDMYWLAREAGRRCLRIAYEGLAWSTINHSLPAVWDVIRQTGEPNLGIVVDAFHIFSGGKRPRISTAFR